MCPGSHVVSLSKDVMTGMYFFPQDFEWPLSSPLDPSEFIEIEVYNFNKIFNNRSVHQHGEIFYDFCQITTKK